MEIEINIKSEFSGIAAGHFTSMQKFALSICKNELYAEEVVSETLLKAFNSFSSVRDKSKTKQWLFRILYNECNAIHRYNKRFVEIESLNNDSGINEDDDNFSLFEALATSNLTDDQNPEIKFISGLTLNQIEKAISELPGEFQSALILSDMQDFTYAEIAETLNIPIGTVRSRIARARSILQKKLWIQANEMGITKSKNVRLKKEYTCTCGKEEAKSSLQTA